MATLVLSSVGTALGGPAGAAIGALIGQSIDQRLLGGKRRGPRVGDLAVQTSSYGTQIPRVYGRMRVAGSVVWATDLVEGAATSGAKGQPDTTYSYSVSIAVALSSRPAMSVGRIWADGKLLRGEDGVFKVPTQFRYYEGGEDQAIDPLIGSIEGIAATPAYRGLALAVFEGLDLVEFGNRIPFLTFELIADEAAPELRSIIENASDGYATCRQGQSVQGYAAYGASMRAAIEPLVECFGMELFDDGSQLRPASMGSPMEILESDLGNSSDHERQPGMDRHHTGMSGIPGTLRLSFYNAASDFENGEVRASAGEQVRGEETVELPATVDEGMAGGLCQQLLARHWSRRDKATLRLPKRFIGLEPGSIVDVTKTGKWTVERCLIDRFAVVAEVRRAADPITISPAPTATAMAAVQRSLSVAAKAPQQDPSELALIDIPDVSNRARDVPTLLLAASSASADRWKSRTVEISVGGQSWITRTARQKSIIGRTLSALGTAEPFLIDRANAVDVQLIDADQWLVSCERQDLFAGNNLALIGSELIQFSEAEPLGGGWFRLSGLIRGCAGTDWAIAGHEAGELFVLIEPGSLEPIELPISALGCEVRVAGADSASAQVCLGGENLRPPSPVHLTTRWLAGGDLAVSWLPRTRRGFAWIDEVDAPPAESRERFQVVLTGGQASVTAIVNRRQAVFANASVARLSTGEATVEVCQIGDWSASKPATAKIEIEESRKI